MALQSGEDDAGPGFGCSVIFSGLALFDDEPAVATDLSHGMKTSLTGKIRKY